MHWMKPLPAKTRLLIALAWLALLAVAGFVLSSRLSMSGDLRKFMPEAQTPAQRLLMDELGEGPGSRLLLMSISGADSETHGRHDPCVGIRATPIAEAMLALTLIDHALRHRAQCGDVRVDTPRIPARRAV